MDKFIFIFVYSACIFGLSADESDNAVNIGVIEDGPRQFTTETITQHGFTVHLHTQFIDMADTYQVFKTVRLFDNSTEYDFILFIKSDPLDITNPQIVQFTRDHVIWGLKPAFALQGQDTDDQSADDTDNMCPVQEHSHLRTYCILHLSDITQTTNGTKIDKVVTLEAPNIIASLVTKQLSWKHVIILHENRTEDKVTGLVDNLSRNGVLFALYNVDNMANSSHLSLVLGQTFNKTMATKSEIHYIVFCQFGCLRRVFTAANAFDIHHRNKTLFKQFSQWLIASYDHTSTVSKTLDQCANQLDNVVVLSLPEISSENSRTGVYEAINQAILAKRTGLDNSSSTLLYHVLNTLEENSKTWHPVISECEALKIETLMYTSRGRNFNLVGYVNMNTRDVVILSDLFPNSNYGYNKRKFLVSTLHYPPFVIKRELKNGTVIYEGLCHDLLAELARTLNFTYELTEPADKKWGSQDGNLTFNGLTGQLQREEVDIAAADLAIQREREMVMDFAFPFYYGDTSVLLRKPDPNEGKWRTLVDPFKWQVLVSIGAMLPIASLLTFLLERFNPFFDHPDNAHLPENSGLRTYIDSFWYMYGALLCQGGYNLPESFAGRTFVSSWWIFSIILVGIYCGNLIAFLTLSKDKPPFNTLDEMAQRSNTYKWGLQTGTFWEDVFVKSQTADFRKVGDLMIGFNKSDPDILSVDVGVHLQKVKEGGYGWIGFNRSDPNILSVKVAVHLQKVKEGGYGWIGDTVTMEIQMAKNCELMMIKDRFLPFKYGFGFTNNSPHTRIFSDKIVSIHESGLLQVWKRKWWPKNNICSGSIVPEAKPIKLVDVQSAFYVAAGGIFLALIAFSAEVAVGKFRRKTKTSKISKADTSSVSDTDDDHGEVG